MLFRSKGIKSEADLGAHVGQNLYAIEIDYMLDHEWAQTADVVLYRRSKVGPFMAKEQKAAVTKYIASRQAGN